MADAAHPTRSTGQAPGGATPQTELTFTPDHSVGAGHPKLRETLKHAKLTLTYIISLTASNTVPMLKIQVRLDSTVDPVNTSQSDGDRLLYW